MFGKKKGTPVQSEKERAAHAAAQAAQAEKDRRAAAVQPGPGTPPPVWSESRAPLAGEPSQPSDPGATNPPGSPTAVQPNQSGPQATIRRGGSYFTTYRDRAGEYRWRLQAANNRIVAVSGEGYANWTDCRDAIDVVMRTEIGTTVAESGSIEDAPGQAFAARGNISSGPVQVGGPVKCDSCALQYVATETGLCPNNNCPQHYRNYPAFRAATGQVIPHLEAAYHPDPST